MNNNDVSPSGTLMKKETVTTQQPDGTVVTKTTETRTMDSSYDESYYGGGFGAPGEFEIQESEFNCVYCCTPLATLRIAQIVVSFIILASVTAGVSAGLFNGVLSGHVFVLIVCFLCVCVTFAIFVAYLLGLHLTIMKACPWRLTDLIYSIIAAVLFFIAGCLEAWYASGTWGSGAEYYRLGWTYCAPSASDPNVWTCPVYVPWIIAAVFCFINCILYAIGACLASFGSYYL